MRVCVSAFLWFPMFRCRYIPRLQSYPRAGMSRCPRVQLPRFSLPVRPVSQHVFAGSSHADRLQLRAFVGGKWEIRSYTPIFFDDGSCEIFFRVYSAPEGAMSRYLQNLQQDDWVEMKGPVGASSHKLEITTQGFAAFGGNRSQVPLSRLFDELYF